MAQTLPTVRNVTIRAYRPADHHTCRRLWAELTQHRSDLRAWPAEPDGGAGFEEYLTRLNLSGMWVAEANGEVIGFVGLMLDGRSGEVDPVVVTQSMRRRGVGRALLGKVGEEARQRGLHRLTVSPLVRDAAALRSLHAAGFATAARVTLSYDLSPRGTPDAEPSSTIDLYDLQFAT